MKARIYSRLGQRGAIFGMAILDAAKNDDKFITLTADLAQLSGMERYTKMYPGQFMEAGIAEQNMVGMAAGLAAEGFHPLVTTYSTFLSMRSCEQIRHYCGYMNEKIILVGSGAGLCQGFAGNTHYTIEDMSIIRAIPNIAVVSPADAGEAVLALEAALEYGQSVYIRLTSNLNCPIVYKNNIDYRIGKANVVKDGNDITVFATGALVSSAIKAANILEGIGVSVCVIDMHTIKPIDKDIIMNTKESTLFVSLEEHNIIGGLGGAISEVMTENIGMPVLLKLGINDTFNLAGDYNNLLEQNRLTPEQIAEDIFIKYNSL